MYVFGFMACVFTYWVDKYMFLRVCRSPPQYDVKLASWSNGSLIWAVVLHLLYVIPSYSQTLSSNIDAKEQSSSPICCIGLDSG